MAMGLVSRWHNQHYPALNKRCETNSPQSARASSAATTDPSGSQPTYLSLAFFGIRHAKVLQHLLQLL